MTATQRSALITHPIGPGGTLILRTFRGSVRVRGSDGADAVIEARYRDGGRASDPEQDGELRITRRDGELGVEAYDVESSLLGALGRLVGGGKPAIDLEVSMPRSATLRLSGVSGDLDIWGLAGDQELRTVSGAISVGGAAGRISLQSVSGDVRIEGTSLELDASTTSGDMEAIVELFERLRIRTVSGDVRAAGALRIAVDHALESISGDVELAPLNGVSIRVTGMSGSIQSELPHRRESGPQKILVVGDGAATLSFRTMSGDLSVVRPGPTGAVSPSFEPPTEAAAPQSRSGDLQPTDELAILRALERGEIDVEQAARLLEGRSSDA